MEYEQYVKVANAAYRLAASSPEYIGNEEFIRRLEYASQVIVETYEAMMEVVNESGLD
jgi:hypothetical protein